MTADEQVPEARRHHQPPRSPVDRLADMSVHQPRVISAPVALRLSGLVMVLAGLFGMHGLTSPGLGPGMDMGMAMGMGTAPSAAMSASDMGVAASGVALTGTGAKTLVGPLADQAHQMTETLPLTGSEPGGMAMNIAMLCLAVIGAALIAVLGFLRRRRAAPVVWSLPRRRPRPVRYRGRDPDPPSLIKLSVQRC